MTPYRFPQSAIGVITPSANVVVEWTAINLMRAFPEVGLHFARTPVSGADDPFPDAYDMHAMLSAARLLADARPSVILWAGSKGALVGIEKDVMLCSAISTETGVRAITPTIALCEMVSAGMRRVVLVTPYTQPYQRRLIEGFERLGITCVAERHAGVSDNLAYAEIEPTQIREMTAAAFRDAGATADVVLTWCTNFATAGVVDQLESELGVPLIDATLLGMKQALSAIGVDPTRASAWGRLFQ
jgi:maleate isomerase